MVATVLGSLNWLGLCFALVGPIAALARRWLAASFLGCGGVLSSFACAAGAGALWLVLALRPSTPVDEELAVLVDLVMSSSATLLISALVWWYSLRKRLRQ
jgi:hypothetical protein